MAGWVVPPSAVGQEPVALRVGAVPYKSEAAFRATYEPLVDYLAAELGRRPEFESVEGPALAFGLANGDYDLGIFTPFPYLEARLDFPRLEVFASHRVRGAEGYRGGFVVRAESSVRELADLRGVAILFVKPTSTSGFKLPQGILRENGIYSEEATPAFSGAHTESLRRLLDGEVAVVAIDLSALDELAASARARLRVVESYAVPYHAYVLAPDLSPDLRLEISRVVLRAHNDPAGRAAFDNPLGIERWVARSDTDYNGVRRFLGMLRSKPQLTLALELKESARRVLERQGDFLDVLRDDLVNRLRATRRFAVDPGAIAGRTVEVDLALVGDLFHCQLLLDGEWLRSIDLTQAELLSRLPELLAHDVLAASPVRSPLLYNGSEWFITHGTNDGVDPQRYDLVYRDAGGGVRALPRDAVRRVTPLNIVFEPLDGFERGAPVTLTYRTIEGSAAGADGGTGAAQTTPHDHADASSLRLFWNNLDNRWGVIGLGVAILSVAVGGALRLRKQRRFRTVLNESLDLLRLYIEGKYDLEARLVEQREKILTYLERNFINENQYLILKHHLDEVETVIAQLASQDVADTQEVQAELKQIVVDGKVTAEELEHLAATLREASGEDELVS